MTFIYVGLCFKHTGERKVIIIRAHINCNRISKIKFEGIATKTSVHTLNFLFVVELTLALCFVLL